MRLPKRVHSRLRQLVASTTALFIASSVMMAVPAHAAASGPPDAPLSVSATAARGRMAITVSWTPAPTSAPRQQFAASLREGGAQQGVATSCFGCTSLVFTDVYPATDWQAVVWSWNPAGYSAGTGSNVVTVSSQCSSAAVCLAVDGTADRGPALLRAQGFLHGIDANTPPSLVAPLRPQAWRLSDWAGAPVAYNSTKPYHPVVTDLLSDLWWEATNDPYRECGGQWNCMVYGTLIPSAYPRPWGGAQTPWSTGPNDDGYRRFVQAVVAGMSTSDRRPDYWDIQNEPGWPNYYDAIDQANSTTLEIEQQIVAAYQAIKAADPNAKVVCPSLGAFVTYAGEAGASTPSFPDLLTFLDAHQVRCDAISWHENDPTQPPVDSSNQPEIIVQHVATMRALLAQHPAQGNPKIFINEYGSPEGYPSSYLSAGSTAGRIAALEAAKVDEANSTCFSECGSGSLDGLLTSDTGGTRPVYWVRAFYAQMTGRTVATSSTASQVDAFATNDPSTSTLRVLVGRHDARATESVSVTIRLPWSASSVTIGTQPIASGTAAVGSPASTTTTAQVVNGQVTIMLPTVNNSDAYTLTLTPAS
jgi:hypothetical protein